MFDINKFKSKRLSKSILWLLIITSGICMIIAIFILPDLIIGIRTVLSNCFPLLVDISNQNPIKFDSYIQTIFTIVGCVITAILTIVAYRLSKKLGKIQFEEQSAKQMLWAAKVSDFVLCNMQIVRKSIDALPRLHELNSDDKEICAQYIINLYTAKLIDKNERKTLEKLMAKFKTMKNMLQTDEQTTMLIRNEITSEYIDLTCIDLRLKDSFDPLIKKLQLISEEGGNYV